MSFNKLKIKSFKSIGIQPTFDLEVNHPDHNYYANGLVTSNSHAVAYASTAEFCVWMKFNHPQQFFLALLRMTKHEPDPFSEIFKITQELPLFGIKLLPPDLIKSKEDFCIEGDNIRYGLSSIKGISDKKMSPISSFGEKDVKTKFDVFLEAKESKIDIGSLCALIQAGCLDSFETERCRLTFEAQMFNKLTEKEKLGAIENGESYNYDIFELLKSGAEGKVLNAKGKSVFTDKRIIKLREEYQNLKKIYDHNRKYDKFCIWFYERKLLGYSYSYSLREVFDESKETFTPLIEFESIEDRDMVRIVGIVTESKKSKSVKTGEKYLRLNISDDSGKVTCLMMDSEKHKKYSNYVDSGKKDPQEDDIVVVVGNKSKDILFIEKLEIVDQHIAFKIRDLKD